jgi:hypothetical protein
LPRISEFFGIVVFMYHNEHGVPHLHARHSGRWVALSIETREVLARGLAPASQALLVRWTELHKVELLENWRLARTGQPLRGIEPLQ